MKLTENEQAICDKYRARDEHGRVHCNECPLNVPSEWSDAPCYATIDGGHIKPGD